MFMNLNERKVKRPKFYIYIILLFILVDVVCDNFIFRTFNEELPITAFFLFLGLSILQILASPIQSGFSDFYGRKQGLLISLSFSLFALCLIYFYSQNILPYFFVVVLAMVIKGSFGNTTPLAWSGIADTHDKNYRFSFGLSTSAFAGAYLLLIFSNKSLSTKMASIRAIYLVVAAILICAFIFSNLKKRRLNETHKYLLVNEIKASGRELKIKHMQMALTAFILWEISLYSILLLYVDFNLAQFSTTALAMMLGYLTGVAILKYVTGARDSTMVKVGYAISTLSLVPFLVTFPFMKGSDIVFLSVCYFFHALGNAFLCPTLFALLAKEKHPDDLGIIYGLVGSADTIAFLIASIAVRIYNGLGLNLIYIISFSFVTVAISWFPYRKFTKIKPKTPEVE
jgi:MFS family permease